MSTALQTSEDVLRLLAAGPTRRFHVGPVDVATWTVGRGPHLVLLHGWPLHSATYRRLLPALARSFTCHLLDMPGAGQTRCDIDAIGGLPDYARVVRGVLDGLALPRYGLLAHDSGAAVARLVAADDPDRVAGLVLAGTEIPGHRPWQLRLYIAVVRVPGGAASFLKLLRLGPIRRSPLAFGGCFTDPATTDGEFSDLFVTPLLRARSVADGHLALLHNFDWSVIDHLVDTHARIRAPVCMIWGEHDAFFPATLAEAMASQFAGPAEFHTIPRARLFCHEDHPEEFLAHALPFLHRTLTT